MDAGAFLSEASLGVLNGWKARTNSEDVDRGGARSGTASS
jgi:hypothetical protein